MKIYMFAVLVMTMVMLSGCKSTMCCPPVSSEAVLKVITVKVDADQNFVVNDKILTVEEFFEQADFEEHSKVVYLDVEQESAISEETVIKAIRYLELRDYLVSMQDGSKYEHLDAICQK